MEIFEALERDAAAVGRDITGAFRRRHTSAAQPAAAVTITSSATQGDPVSLSADLHAFAARIEAIGDDAVTDLERVQANPETAKVFTALRDLTGLNVAPGIIGIVASGLDALVTELGHAAPAAPEPQGVSGAFTPAGPQVAGQA